MKIEHLETYDRALSHFKITTGGPHSYFGEIWILNRISEQVYNLSLSIKIHIICMHMSYINLILVRNHLTAVRKWISIDFLFI